MSRLYPEFLGGARGVALLFLRLVAGIAFMIHGWPKIQHPTSWMPPEAPVPGVLQLAAAVAEFGGGLCWVIGALTPFASVLILCTMAFATFMVHVRMGHPFVSSAPGGHSFESALGYLAISVLFLVVGPGRLSIDSALFGRGPVRKPTTAGELAG